MDEPNIGFRSTFLGGFHKEDVLRYIQKNDNDHYEESETLKKQFSEAQTMLDELRGENEALTQKNAELLERLGKMTIDIEKKRTEFEEADKKLALRETEIETQNAYSMALSEENIRLREENIKLSEKCSEYDAAKEKIAEIELSAYRRAKQIEEDAKQEMSKIRQQSAEMIERVKKQLEETKENYRTVLTRSQQETEQMSKKANEVIGEIDRISGNLIAATAEKSKNFREKLNELFIKSEE